jgi:uncharacterized membrane protein
VPLLKRRTGTARMTTFEVLAFSALSGLRSTAGPALLSRAARRGDVEDPKVGPLGPLSRLSPLLSVSMIGEMAADKTRFVGSRTSPGPLFGRAVSGALVAAALFAARGRGGKGSDAGSGALLGALSAVAGAYAGENLRSQGAQWLSVPDPVLALLEDGLVLAAGTQLLRRSTSQ